MLSSISASWPAALVAVVVSTGMTIFLSGYFRRRAILDVANERSLHAVPTPRGGGWAILAGLIAGGVVLLGLDGGPGRDHAAGAGIQGALRAGWPLICGTFLVAAVSWLDDIRTISSLPRFATQIVAVGLGLLTLHGHTFQGWLPEPLDLALSAFAWLWFVNLFNFMDGMDGLAGGEALAIAYGIFLVTGTPFALVIAAAALGFLAWNWAPAKIFMGDIGSIPLGYVLGGLLLQSAGAGHWAAALVLPLYFLIDATITLLKRMLRREKFWQAHRQHFYQQAVLAGRSHRVVAIAALAANGLLVAIALLFSAAYPVLSIAAAVLVVAALIAWMAWPGLRKARDAGAA